MDRREFVKMLGAGGLLIGLGALVGAGCAEEPEEPMMDPDAPPPEAGGPPPDAPPAPPVEGEEEPPEQPEEPEGG